MGTALGRDIVKPYGYVSPREAMNWKIGYRSEVAEEIPFRLGIGIRPLSLIGVNEILGRHARKGDCRTCAGLGFLLLRVAPELDLGENFPRPLAGVVRLKGGDVADCNSPVFRPNSILYDPGSLSPGSEPDSEPGQRVVENDPFGFSFQDFQTDDIGT
ncbi:hypothetical protein ASF41_22515 [Methylobacterium sp. Leaf111]|nr:hypothetical protein ASF41_22515 [Methylobacterium sp. Leaf111]